MEENVNKYDDIVSASNNLNIIASELNIIGYHLNKLNENMKVAIRGSAGEYFTNTLVPLGIKKSKDLSEKSSMLAKRLNLVLKTLDNLESNIEDTSLDFL